MAQDTSPQHVFGRSFNRFTTLVMIVFAILAVRLWYLTQIEGARYTRRSEENRTRVIRTSDYRGKIMDRNGKILVDNRLSFNLIYNPNYLKDEEQRDFLEKVCRKIDCDPNALTERLSEKTDPITLKQDLSRAELARVETMSMLYEGRVFPLHIEKVGKRAFHEEVKKSGSGGEEAKTYGELFAHVIGYTAEISPEELELPEYGGFRPGDRVGRSGIEKQYEQHLRAEFGQIVYEENARGVRLRVIDQQSAQPGKDLLLNIDLDLQRMAKLAMDQFSFSGAVVALDPRNGKVLALYSAPTFNPELFTRPMNQDTWNSLNNHPRHPLQNKAVSGLYPPGSTFKVVSALAGLQEKVIDVSKTFTCNGKWEFRTQVFRCHNTNGHGVVDFYRGIKHSCDVYYYKLAVLLGIDRMAQYARTFGVGRPTGIDLPGELAGLMPDRDWSLRVRKKRWLPGQTLNTSIGQGDVTMTPLQLAVMYAAVANKGTVYRPQIVDQILSPGGRVIQQFEPEIVGHVPIDEENFNQLHIALGMVVNDEGGSGKEAKVEGMRIAGKTGTSQVRRIGKVRRHFSLVPYEHRDHAIFAAFAPMEEPEIVVTVIIEHGGYGSLSAAPVAHFVLKKFKQLRDQRLEKEAAARKDAP